MYIASFSRALALGLETSQFSFLLFYILELYGWNEWDTFQKSTLVRDKVALGMEGVGATSMIYLYFLVCTSGARLNSTSNRHCY